MGFEKGNRSKVQVWKNGQVMVTVPRAIAEAARLRKGDDIAWYIENGRLVVERQS